MARSSKVPRLGVPRNTADRPLTVVNVGNTHVRVVRFLAGAPADDRRVPTGEAADLTLGGPIALVAVVPAVADALAARHADVFRVTAATVALAIDYDPPSGLGADRLANALALWRGYGAGIAIDCGTATTLTVVDALGVVRGGAILPGLATARDALWRGTAQLPSVPLEAVAEPIGRSTLASLQIGLVHGHAGALLHLIARMGGAEHLVVTGGWGGLMAGLLPGSVHAPDLTIAGARLAYLEACERA